MLTSQLQTSSAVSLKKIMNCDAKMTITSSLTRSNKQDKKNCKKLLCHCYYHIYSIKCPTSNKRPSWISAHPVCRKVNKCPALNERPPPPFEKQKSTRGIPKSSQIDLSDNGRHPQRMICLSFKETFNGKLKFWAMVNLHVLLLFTVLLQIKFNTCWKWWKFE